MTSGAAQESVGTDRSGRDGAAFPDPVLPAWPGFALAAAAAVQHLSGALGMDLWMVTHVEGERQVVVASSGGWSGQARPGQEFPWRASFCRPMVERRGPMVAGDVRAVPAYAERAVGPLAPARAYLGVPLVGDDGELFGTLCAFGGREEPGLARGLPLVQLVAQMLSTVLAGQQVALARSQEAAAAYALAERDRLTGLRNRRGWEAAVAQEHSRCERYGAPAGVLVLGVDRLAGVDPDEGLSRAAQLLRAAVRPGDALARVGDAELAVLAVQCDPVSLRSLLGRVRGGLRAAGLTVSCGAASRRPGETLEQTWRRAEALLARDRRPRAARQEGVPALP